jgi:hypothetical protein
MNTSISMNSIRISASQPALPAKTNGLRFVAHLVHAIQNFIFKPQDDPAALRYIASKYPAEFD